jgi:secondary thiamine-phosphate synthase enzyme
MVFYREIAVHSQSREQWLDISSAVQQVCGESALASGIVTVASLHTTAGLTINENADPDVGRDIFWKLGQLIPHRDNYRHGEGNSDSHLKASLIGLSVQLPLQEGRLVLGRWQSIYFCEFDGPRDRHVAVTVMGE